MDIYGKAVATAAPLGSSVKLVNVRAVNVGAIEFGPVGCVACTSGDSPIFDLEQNILFGR